MEQENQDLNILLKEYQDKKGVLLLTKNGFRYVTDNLKVVEDSISFDDRFGDKILLAISEISQVTLKHGEENDNST